MSENREGINTTARAMFCITFLVTGLVLGYMVGEQLQIDEWVISPEWSWLVGTLCGGIGAGLVWKWLADNVLP